MRKKIFITIIYCVVFFNVFSFEPFKKDVILEERLLDSIERQTKIGDYVRMVRDTVFTILCFNYDTTSKHRAFDIMFPYYFDEKNIGVILQKRTFNVNEIVLLDSLMRLEFQKRKERFVDDYKLFSKSLYPYLDANGNKILMVSGYIRYEDVIDNNFPIVYDGYFDDFLAKINVTERKLIFLR